MRFGAYLVLVGVFLLLSGILTWFAIMLTDWASSTRGPLLLRGTLALALILTFLAVEVYALMVLTSALKPASVDASENRCFCTCSGDAGQPCR